jgi:hypothetical protein
MVGGRVSSHLGGWKVLCFDGKVVVYHETKANPFLIWTGNFALRASLQVYVWVLICLHSLRVGGFQASKVFLRTKLLQTCNSACCHGNCDEELNYNHIYLLNHICGLMIKDKMVDWWNIILSISHSEPAATSAPWRMNGKWSGDSFLLSSKSLANYGC